MASQEGSATAAAAELPDEDAAHLDEEAQSAAGRALLLPGGELPLRGRFALAVNNDVWNGWRVHAAPRRRRRS